MNREAAAAKTSSRLQADTQQVACRLIAISASSCARARRAGKQLCFVSFPFPSRERERAAGAGRQPLLFSSPLLSCSKARSLLPTWPALPGGFAWKQARSDSCSRRRLHFKVRLERARATSGGAKAKTIAAERLRTPTERRMKARDEMSVCLSVCGRLQLVPRLQLATRRALAFAGLSCVSFRAAG